MEESGNRRAEAKGMGDGGEDREDPVHGAARSSRTADEEDNGHPRPWAGGILQFLQLVRNPPVTVSVGVLFGLSKPLW